MSTPATVALVHPIERLRYVARTDGIDQALLVRETAASIAGLGLDHAGAVTAARRVVQRHPFAGAVWNLCARVLTAIDPDEAAWSFVEQVESDQSPMVLDAELPPDARVLLIGWPDLVPAGLLRRGDLELLVADVDGEGSRLVRRLDQAGLDAEVVSELGIGAAAGASDLVVLEAMAAGPSGSVVCAGSLAAASTARLAGLPVWLVVGVGRALDRSAWATVESRLGRDERPWEATEELVPLDLVDIVIGPDGSSTSEIMGQRADGPPAPELSRQLGW